MNRTQVVPHLFCRLFSEKNGMCSKETNRLLSIEKIRLKMFNFRTLYSSRQ